jgi:hypothetical protein
MIVSIHLGIIAYFWSRYEKYYPFSFIAAAGFTGGGGGFYHCRLFS